MRKSFYIFILLIMCCLEAAAQQITGYVIDASTGDSIPHASIQYKGHKIAAISDISGHFSIARHDGWNLTISALGYKSRIVAVNNKTKNKFNIRLKPDEQQLAEVEVKVKRQRYSRKNNPAVDLMRKVVDAKKENNLELNDYYSYNKYEKLTVAANDLKPEQLEKKPYSTHTWMLDQVETSPYTGKLIMPISVDETVSQKIYRKEPKSTKTIIHGQTSKGVNNLIQTGDILNVVVKDVFTDVDLYKDHIRLLQYPFISPLSNEGIGFYRYYIEDTVMVEKDRCIHLHFLPNNQQDMGFRGDLYILDDSTYHIRRAQLTIPKQSIVNFVENLQVTQEYERLDDGQWVLTVDDMVTELTILSFVQSSLLVTRTTRLSDYAFDPIPAKLFRGQKKEVTEADAQMRDEEFWNQYRQVELTKSESRMSKFISNIENMKGFKYVIFALRALFENSIETSTPNYIDICPVNTFLTKNFVDGWRSRLSLKTTANLNKHLFLSGYYAHGWGSGKNYYSIEGTYSLNPKAYLPHEFPRRTLTVQSTYDVGSPGDRFMDTDKDNFMVALKWAETNKMMFYNRQRVAFEYETDWGLKATFGAKYEENEACGAMSFRTLDQPRIEHTGHTGNGEFMKTTEISASLRFAPGETYINNKLRRRTINLDAPVFTVSHTTGLRGVLGGQYEYNYSEAHIYKRFWLSSWGKLDVSLRAGIQWNQVPYPLLCHPAANQSYIIIPETFNLINTLEFLNDRYASLIVSWDLNGKLFNRIPLIKKLKWREFFAIRTLWGTLTDKNNPYLPQNAGNPRLMYFPEGSNIMDSRRPYSELVIGVHNIFKFFHVEHVRRLSYTNLPTSEKWGMRYVIEFSF